MCGIFGFNFEDRNIIKKMGDILNHRGPDDEGYFLDENVSLGHKRLSIIDLSKKGQQPMSNEDGSIWITYNGEIYNFKELRKILKKMGHKFYSDTDTEVIIHSYEEWGIKFLDKIRGMFAFALYDSNNDILFLVRDRLGIKPLYYYWDQEKLIFASEIKAILEHNIKREVNNLALDIFLNLRYIYAPFTIFKRIMKLPPGHYLLYNFKDKCFYINKYWDVKFNITRESEHYYISKIRQILKDSVEIRLISDVPLGVYLSGGLDSSIIVGLMSKFVDTPIRTFSVGFGYEKYDEIDYARRVSEYFETEHKEFIVEPDLYLLPEVVYHFDEPIADPAAIPTYILSKEAKKYVTVILTGEGGDELFAGYRYYKTVLKKDTIKYLSRILPENILKYFMKFKNFGKLFKFLLDYKDEIGIFIRYNSIFDNYTIKNASLNVDHKIILQNLFNNNLKKMNSDLLDKLLYLSLKISLPDNLLMKVDKMTMAHAVEARVPFLDHKLVELSAQIPSKLKIKNNIEKYILRKSFKYLLPIDIAKRKKHGFTVPIHLWMDTEPFKSLIDEAIEDKNMWQNYFEYYNVVKWFKYGTFAQKWSLINFYLWYKIFMENEKEMRI